MTDRENMLLGEPYRPADPELVELRRRARRLTRLFNTTTEDEPRRRNEIFRELLGRTGAEFEVEPPFRCDYGLHITIGEHFYMNFDCVILDCARVEIGDHAFISPGVHIYTAYHPINTHERNSGVELARPVKIGHNVWLGGHVTICPGVTIGDNVTIGAGSVVVHNIPPSVVAAGNPCRVFGPIDRR